MLANLRIVCMYLIVPFCENRPLSCRQIPSTHLSHETMISINCIGIDHSTLNKIEVARKYSNMFLSEPYSDLFTNTNIPPTRIRESLTNNPSHAGICSFFITTDRSHKGANLNTSSRKHDGQGLNLPSHQLLP